MTGGYSATDELYRSRHPEADHQPHAPSPDAYEQWLREGKHRLSSLGPDHAPSTTGEPEECDSEAGITVSLLDALIALIRVLVDRDLEHPSAVKALDDLMGHDDLVHVFGNIVMGPQLSRDLAWYGTEVARLTAEVEKWREAAMGLVMNDDEA